MVPKSIKFGKIPLEKRSSVNILRTIKSNLYFKNDHNKTVTHFILTYINSVNILALNSYNSNAKVSSSICC